MVLGTFSIGLSLVAVLIAALQFFQASRLEAFSGKKKNKENLINAKLKQGRLAYNAMFLFVGIASLYLWYLIFTHQFQVDYIYRYSSRDLGIGYLFSAFWAGQEGSFLFWALTIAVMGFLFMRKASDYESTGMMVVSLVQAGFMIILLKANPFELSGMRPTDGAGLNPLLQNPWMVIHPPILFLGYAAVTIPFAVSIATIVKKSYQNWALVALPWTLFASVTLGAGIIIGAFWAYEVLGWGGYWGWDPVENSSLMVWLAVLALFHGLIVTRRNGALHKTNLVMAVLSFALVMYATFLTRSGVLADFSVHSFADEGLNFYLVSFIGLILIIGFGFIFKGWKEIPLQKLDISKITKESFIIYAIWTLMICLIFVFVGTSSPILTSIVGDPSQVEISFYDRMNLPVAIIMALLLSIAPVLIWIPESLSQVAKRLIPSFVFSILALLLALFTGMDKTSHLIFTWAGSFALATNLWVAIKRWKNLRLADAPIAHFGVGLMFVGIIVSGVFSEEERVVLTQNETTEVFGYSLTYTKDFNSPDGKGGIVIDVKSDKVAYEAKPRFYMNNYTRGVMSEPDVKAGVFSDFYISPLQKMAGEEQHSGPEVTLGKGEKTTYGGFEIEFVQFAMAGHGDGGFRVGADLKIRREGHEHIIQPALLMEGNERRPLAVNFPHNSNVRVAVVGINADAGQVNLAFSGLEDHSDHDHTSQMLVEVSKKPFMNVLWLGTIILTIGTIMAWRKRQQELVE